MNIVHHLVDGVGQVRFQGELNIYYATQAREALLPLLQGVTALELDLSEVSDIDSAGLQVLLAAGKTLAAGGAPVRVTQASSVVADALALTGLAAYFAPVDNLVSRQESSHDA